jgi:uncharacterized phage protein (TIGR01671 family)
MNKREYKFRAWLKKEKRYIYLTGFCFENREEIRLFYFELCKVFDFTNDYILCSHLFKIDDIVIEQYTGFKDNKGKDIYEKDIAKVTDALGNEHKGVISFLDGCFEIYFFDFIEIDGVLKARDYLKCWIVNHVVEVIGNKYENIDLFNSLLKIKRLDCE